MKKWKCVLLLLAMAAVLMTGCGKDAEKQKDTQETDTQAPAVSPAAGPLRIAMVTGSEGVADNGFLEGIYGGIQEFAAEYPDTQITQVVVETQDTKAAAEKIDEIAADYQAVVCCGYQFEEIGSITRDYPEVGFLLVDAYPKKADGTEAVMDNVYAMKFAEQESGFCVGMAAALESKSGKVAVVNGMAYPSNINYQRGFNAGVDYANKHHQTNAEVIGLSEYAGKDGQQDIGGNYIGSFEDEEKGKTVAKLLMDKGVDVIFAAAGKAGKGVFAAVREEASKPDVRVIGCDVDQYDDGMAEDRNIVLTSAVKAADVMVGKQLENIKEGIFHGENALLKADTYSTGYVKERGRHQLSEETIRRIDDAFALVKDGTIEIPYR